jgi:hypothetical protein
VLSGEGFSASVGYCRWRLVAGGAWSLRGGCARGHSQSSRAGGWGGGGGGGGGGLCFDAPVDAWLRTSSLVGWPQLLLSVWSVDAHGRHALAGYGLARVPPGAGAHALEVACWRPEGSRAQEGAAAFLDARVQLTDTAAVYAAGARHLLATASAGSVLVELQVLLRGLEERGVETAGPEGLAAAPAPL